MRASHRGRTRRRGSARHACARPAPDRTSRSRRRAGCPRLRHLDLAGNCLTSVPRLLGCNALQELILDDNAICDGVDLLPHTQRLTTLQLRDNHLGAAAAAPGGRAAGGEAATLGRALRRLGRLTCLDLRSNPLHRTLLPSPAGWALVHAPKLLMIDGEPRGGAPRPIAPPGIADAAVPPPDSPPVSPASPLAALAERAWPMVAPAASDSASGPACRDGEGRLAGGGLFGVSLATLAGVRAAPPPFVGEAGALLLQYVHSASAIGTALADAAHPSSRQTLDELCAAMESQGAYASLLPSLRAIQGPLPAEVGGGGAGGGGARACVLALGALMRFLRALPEPPCPYSAYAQLLSSTLLSDAPDALMRALRALPPPHAALVQVAPLSSAVPAPAQCVLGANSPCACALAVARQHLRRAALAMWCRSQRPDRRAAAAPHRPARRTRPRAAAPGAAHARARWRARRCGAFHARTPHLRR